MSECSAAAFHVFCVPVPFAGYRGIFLLLSVQFQRGTAVTNAKA
jgi:hypothetical protein